MGKGLLVLQSDFGISDGAVSAMYGVSHCVDPDIKIYDITHQIPQFNIWEGSYRLLQTVQYWPEGTVFVSVVDPGVGSDRKAVVVKTVNDQFIVTPDNGTLTHIKRYYGIAEIREIDETINRLPNSGESHTFHGRDIFAYTGARLAAGIISFEEVGPALKVSDIVELNIRRSLFKRLAKKYGDTFEVTISTDNRKIYQSIMTYGHSFADLRVGEPLLYINSLDNVGIAINQGSFADAYHVGTGTNWVVSIRKAPKIIYA